MLQIVFNQYNNFSRSQSIIYTITCLVVMHLITHSLYLPFIFRTVQSLIYYFMYLTLPVGRFRVTSTPVRKCRLGRNFCSPQSLFLEGVGLTRPRPTGVRKCVFIYHFSSPLVCFHYTLGMLYLIGCEIHECEIVRRNISCVYSFDHSFLLVIVIVSFPFGNKLLDLVFGVLCW